MISLIQGRIAGQIYLSGHEALRQFTPVHIFINGPPFVISDFWEILGLTQNLFPARRSCSVLFAVAEIAECFHPKSTLWFLDHLSIWLAPSFISHLSGFRPLASMFLMFPPHFDWHKTANLALEPRVGQAWPPCTPLNTLPKEVWSQESYQPFFKEQI